MHWDKPSGLQLMLIQRTMVLAIQAKYVWCKNKNMKYLNSLQREKKYQPEVCSIDKIVE